MVRWKRVRDSGVTRRRIDRGTTVMDPMSEARIGLFGIGLDAYWPQFREIDFLRALRSYGARQRRFGG